MIFCGSFLVSQCRNFYTGIFKCFIDFGDRKTLCIRGVGHDILSEFFCLIVPKKFIGLHFCVSEILWYRKNLWI